MKVEFSTKFKPYKISIENEEEHHSLIQALKVAAILSQRPGASVIGILSAHSGVFCAELEYKIRLNA